MDITSDNYQELARRTVNPNLTEAQRLDHAALGMCSEAGEFASLLQKQYQGHPLDMNHAIKELGDLLWFVAEACDVLDTTFDEVMAENVQKLIDRYPDGFSEFRSMHRVEGDI